MNQQIHSIKYPFAIDSGVGTLAEETNFSAHVDQMIRQLLLTNPGDRINRPDFGCGLSRMVFAPNSDVSANLTQVTITQSLEKWLGNLLEVISVNASVNDDQLLVGIVYLLKATQQKKYLNLEVTL